MLAAPFRLVLSSFDVLCNVCVMIAVVFVGDVQAVLLRPEPHLQLFGAHSDAHLARTLHRHQAPDVDWSVQRSTRRKIRVGDVSCLNPLLYVVLVVAICYLGHVKN